MKAKKGVNFTHKLQLAKGSSFSELKGGPNECYRSVLQMVLVPFLWVHNWGRIPHFKTTKGDQGRLLLKIHVS